MTTEVRRPSIDMFGKRGSNGWAKTFVNGLERGVPRELPAQYQTESGRAALYNAGKQAGRKLRTLTFDGTLWVAWV